MKQVLELVARLIVSQPTFKDRIQALADSAGIDTRSHGGISCDIVSLKDDFKEMTYIEFIAVMLTCMVRSYTGKDDTELVGDLDISYNEHAGHLTIAEKLFYRLLKFRLGEVQFETPPWNEECIPIWVALAAKVDEIEVDDEIPRF
jgi:hypothetical protein